MKKIINYISVFICSFLLIINNVNAASYSVSLTSNTVTIGNTVTLTINASDMAGKFTVSSSNTNVAKLSQTSTWIDNGKASITISANQVGSSTITIVPEDVTDYDGNGVSGNKTLTITVKNKQTNSSPNKNVTVKKSTNNYLSSLTIDEYSLDKEFNKETLEYGVTLPSEVDKIKINAQLDDSTAEVTGTGEREVTVGENIFEIKVTAQNGDVKTYKLTAIVQEPTEIEINNQKYKLMEKEGLLEEIEGYEKTTINIEDKDILAYYNEKTKYNLVILQDEEGNNNYYLYENGNYTLYEEYNFSGVRLYLLDNKMPENYVKRELIIEDKKINAYQLDTTKKNTTYAIDTDTINNYYLVYAMNINTGNKNYYLIDKKENTAIRYDEELNSLFLNIDKDNNYKTYFFILLGVVGVIFVVFAINLIVNGRKKKHKLNFK